MPSNLATTIDVETLFRRLEPDEHPLVQRLLRMASAMIRSKIANLDLRISNATLDPNTVTDVVAMMVVRVLRNQEGVTQETIGSVSATLSPLVAPGYLTVTEDEIALLTPATAVRASVGTINLVPSMARGGSHFPLRRPL